MLPCMGVRVEQQLDYPSSQFQSIDGAFSSPMTNTSGIACSFVLQLHCLHFVVTQVNDGE